jgi:hypothetical protein
MGRSSVDIHRRDWRLGNSRNAKGLCLFFRFFIILESIHLSSCSRFWARRFEEFGFSHNERSF